MVLSSESTKPIESRQFNNGEQVKTAGIFGLGSGGKDMANKSAIYPSSPEPPHTTISPIPPTTNENLIYGKQSR